MPFKYDFKQIAEAVDIYAVAKLLNLKVVKDRADCPLCGGDRALEFKPETNSFICYKGEPRDGCEYLSGDCITLYAHITGVGMYQAAKTLSQHFQHAPAAGAPTAPQKPEGRTEKSQPAPKSRPGASTRVSASATSTAGVSFNPDEFAAKLAYGEEVQEIGLSEEAAAQYRVGVRRGKLYLPICPPGVTPAGFAEYHDGKLRLPDKWLSSNVVPLRQKMA